MTNPFASRAASLSGPAHDYLPVTPDDAADLSEVAVALYAETGGTVTFDSVRGTTRTVRIADHGWVLCGIRRVHATGTTAGGLHAMVVG